MKPRDNRPPPEPPGFDSQEFFEGIHWHQRWELFESVFTPGRNPVTDILSYAGVPPDLSGKSVLDVGAWNGGFSFECAPGRDPSCCVRSRRP